MMGHHHRLHASVVAAAVLVLTALVACGGAHVDGAESARRQGASVEGAIPICGLLTAQQVSSVLPNHDGGMQVASGPSLTKNINNYQCSYTAARGNDADLLTVIVLVGSDSAAFQSIKPNRSAKEDNFPIFRELKIGEGGMLYGKPGDIQVETWQGTTAVSLELIAPEAERRADPVARLAEVVASKVK